MSGVLSCLDGAQGWRLIALAGIVGLLASLAAISFFERALVARERRRALLIAGAGGVAAWGIWCAHLLAMLACHAGLPADQSVGWLAAAILVTVALLVGGFALAAGKTWWHAPAGGGIIGIGVAAIHLLFDAAAPAEVTASTQPEAFSLALGVMLPVAALTLSVHYPRVGSTALAALLLTVAIVLPDLTMLGV